MSESLSIFARFPVPVWAIAAAFLTLVFLAIWAAMPLLMKRVNPRMPFATPEANALVWLVVGLGALLFLGAVGAAFAVLQHTFTAAQEGGDGPDLGAGALIGALLGGPFLIWGTILKHQTVRFQKEGHMTDRIAKAVEQLGAEKTVKGRLVNSAGKKVFEKDKNGKLDYSRPVTVEETQPNLEVRVGAILSLERIAQDSATHDHGRDHVMVMEILCANIRHNAPASGAKRYRNKRDFSDKIDSSLTSEKIGPRLDVHMALEVLARRRDEQIGIEELNRNTGESAYRLDLSLTNLQFAKILSAKFRNINLRDAYIDGAWLSESDFRGANLLGVSAVGLNARASNFEGANLGADMTDAFLDEARITFTEDENLFASFNCRSEIFSRAKILNTVSPKANLEQNPEPEKAKPTDEPATWGPLACGLCSP